MSTTNNLDISSKDSDTVGWVGWLHWDAGRRGNYLNEADGITKNNKLKLKNKLWLKGTNMASRNDDYNLDISPYALQTSYEDQFGDSDAILAAVAQRY